jgi:hypothetical protein
MLHGILLSVFVASCRAEEGSLLVLSFLSLMLSGFYTPGAYPLSVQTICTVLVAVPALAFLLFMVAISFGLCSRRCGLTAFLFGSGLRDPDWHLCVANVCGRQREGARAPVRDSTRSVEPVCLMRGWLLCCCSRASLVGGPLDQESESCGRACRDAIGCALRFVGGFPSRRRCCCLRDSSRGWQAVGGG